APPDTRCYRGRGGRSRRRCHRVVDPVGGAYFIMPTDSRSVTGEGPLRQALDCRRQHSGRRPHGASTIGLPRRVSHRQPHRPDRFVHSGACKMTDKPIDKEKSARTPPPYPPPQAGEGRVGVRRVVNESGIEIKPLYTAEDVLLTGGIDASRAGEAPFTRGIHPLMYRHRPWTMRQYTGFANAADTNKRFKYLIANGQTGLNVAFDLATQCGYDSDAPEAVGEVGRVGMAVDTLRDFETV